MLDTPDDNPKNNQNNQGCLGFMVQWHPMIISLHQWSPRALFTFLQVHTSSTFQFLRTCLRIFKYLVYTNWLFFIFQMCLINTLSYHVLSVSHICLLKRWIVRIFNAVLETSSIFWLKGTMIISQKMTESFFPTNKSLMTIEWTTKTPCFPRCFFGLARWTGTSRHTIAGWPWTGRRVSMILGEDPWKTQWEKQGTNKKTWFFTSW